MSRLNVPLAAAALLAIAGGVGVVVLLLQSSPLAPPKSVAPPVPGAKQEPPRPASGVVEKPAPVPVKPEPAAVVTFPDGSTAPLLNGVDQPVKLIWNDRPYAPIKTKVLSQGLEWYLHEDGSHSTVQWVDMNGVRSAIGMVASPTDALPTSEQINDQVRRQGQPPR